MPGIGECEQPGGAAPMPRTSTQLWGLPGNLAEIKPYITECQKLGVWYRPNVR